nr:class A beta-lactamase [Roseomonas acroporae]
MFGQGAVGQGTVSQGTVGQGDAFAALPAALARIEAAHGGRLGVAVLDAGDGRAASYRAEERFPLGSTYKLLAAGAVLARVAAGRERLDRRIRFDREALVAYSPATAPYAGGEGLTLAALCEAAVAVSDNTAGNLLLEALDGPAGLTAWLRSLGDGVTRLDRTETALNEALPGDPRDTTAPAAMLADLHALTQGSALPAEAAGLLLGWLRASRNGDARLRAGLPAGWQAAGKTGTAGNGTSSDVALLRPPGRAAPVLVAAYLTGSPAPPPARDAVLAAVGAAIAGAWVGALP